MIIKTNRGLKLEIPEAEIFCEIETKDNETRIEQRGVAFHLYLHYLDKNNYDKAVKYAILATGSKPNIAFQFSATDAFNWYNVLRVFVGSINRLFTFFKAAFLPIWYPVTGLFYAVQALVAAKEGNKENSFYWSTWLLFNGFGALVLFGVLAASGVGLPIAALAIGLYSFVFDVKWDVYKYTSERSQHEKLFNKLNDDIVDFLKINNVDQETLKSLKNKSDKELFETLRPKLGNDLLSTLKSKLLLKEKLAKNIQKMKGDRIEATAVDTTILIGGFLFLLSLSSFLPPLAAAVGASFIFGAFSYLVAKKTYNSWTSPTGFLNHYVRKPIANFLERCAVALKKAMEPKVSTLPIGSKRDLFIQVPTDSRRTTLSLEESSSSPSSSTSSLILTMDSKSESKSASPITPVLTQEIVDKLNDAENIVKGFVDLSPQHQQAVKDAITTEMKMGWNEALDVFVQKYKNQKQGEFYTCSIKQSIKTAINHYQYNLLPQERKNPEGNTAQLEKEIEFLKAREKECNGDKKHDLELIAVSKKDFPGEKAADLGPDLDCNPKMHLLHMLGIKNFEKYQTQLSHWEKWYGNDKRIISPFFDRSLQCAFEAGNLDTSELSRSPRVLA